MAEPDESNGTPTFIRITNQMVYAELQATRADVRALNATLQDYTDLKRRIRSLELKFYGILAGLVAATTIVVAGALPG